MKHRVCICSVVLEMIRFSEFRHSLGFLFMSLSPVPAEDPLAPSHTCMGFDIKECRLLCPGHWGDKDWGRGQEAEDHCEWRTDFFYSVCIHVYR